jgi:hypothetical protein
MQRINDTEGGAIGRPKKEGTRSMPAQQLLVAAVTMQREGVPQAEIETNLIEQARREEPPCHCQRNFDGRVALVFADGQVLSYDGRVWSLAQQQQVAPLYASTIAAFGPAASEHNQTTGA